MSREFPNFVWKRLQANVFANLSEESSPIFSGPRGFNRLTFKSIGNIFRVGRRPLPRGEVCSLDEIGSVLWEPMVIAIVIKLGIALIRTEPLNNMVNWFHAVENRVTAEV